MRNFKIKVTPKESEVIQKLLFLTGYSWCDGTTEVYRTGVRVLARHFQVMPTCRNAARA